ncbi:alcohol dehydrogenase catalytic domain-containing protein [Deinococcus sp.]|uniref:zinc-dependent alcohol dehydrogenase n=1 Tax=Deinococcus sp. TaxID=47478 RepID=UPI003C7A766C
MVHARRWTLHGSRDLRLERVELAAPGPGQVLVETCLSAVSVASELSVYLGRVTPDSLPHSLGYQSLGRVQEVGPGVTDLISGQRVVSTWGHASHALVQGERLMPVPEGVPDRLALAVILGEESMKGIRKLALPPGSEVLVTGAGLLGLLSVFNLTRRGHRAFVREPVPARRDLARRFGATEAAGEKRLHFALECSASPAGFQELLESLRPGGRVVVLSDGNWGTLGLSPAFHRRELTVMASSDGEDYPAYARWLWPHADPLLEELFGASLPASALAFVLPALDKDPQRPVSVVLDWGNQSWGHQN